VLNGVRPSAVDYSVLKMQFVVPQKYLYVVVLKYNILHLHHVPCGSCIIEQVTKHEDNTVKLLYNMVQCYTISPMMSLWNIQDISHHLNSQKTPGKLWGVFSEYFDQFWLCYTGGSTVMGFSMSYNWPHGWSGQNNLQEKCMILTYESGVGWLKLCSIFLALQ